MLLVPAGALSTLKKPPASEVVGCSVPRRTEMPPNEVASAALAVWPWKSRTDDAGAAVVSGSVGDSGALLPPQAAAVTRAHTANATVKRTEELVAGGRLLSSKDTGDFGEIARIDEVCGRFTAAPWTDVQAGRSASTRTSFAAVRGDRRAATVRRCARGRGSIADSE